MADHDSELHFVLIPLMSPGHLIPMVDIAKLLAQQGVIVSVVSTPLNTLRIKPTIDSAVERLGLKIRVLDLRFPGLEAGLPEGCENMDSLPSRDTIKNYFEAVGMLQEQFETLFRDLAPRPRCIISGKNLAWTVETARKFNVPRLFFDGMGCFSFTCTQRLQNSRIHENVSRFEEFVVPNLPHEIKLTRAQLPEALNPGSEDLIDVRNKIVAAESVSDGIIVNSFKELENEYVDEYKKLKGCKVWCIGPVSACNKLEMDKFARGNERVSTKKHPCLEWLDKQEPRSVVYACLGSICGLSAPQLKEVGLGLEASKSPFIWVIRGGEKTKELEKWIQEENFEERTSNRGYIIRGWSPQLLVLSHPSVGAFLTHCGWNSTLEGACSGKVMITCPLFAEQFINERLVVDVLGIGVSVGVKAAVAWGIEEKSGIVIKQHDVMNAVRLAMENSRESEGRRERAMEIANMAKRATQEDGSSYVSVKDLIQHVMQQTL